MANTFTQYSNTCLLLPTGTQPDQQSIAAFLSLEESPPPSLALDKLL